MRTLITDKIINLIELLNKKDILLNKKVDILNSKIKTLAHVLRENPDIRVTEDYKQYWPETLGSESKRSQTLAPSSSSRFGSKTTR